MTTKSKSLGELADELYNFKIRCAAAQKVADDLKAEQHALETVIINALTDAGITAIRGTYDTIGLSESVRPQIADPAAFEAFVLRKKALHLFERRISVKAYNEMKLLLKGKPIPGLNEFVQTKLSVRKIAKE